MEYISFGKWSVWMPICVMLNLLAVPVIAQPGFVSVDCGGKENHTDKNNITWETDANYIDVGQTTEIGNVYQQALGSCLQSLRFFPKPLNKSCYHFRVTPNVPYLVREWFAAGNYTGFQDIPNNFTISLETQGMLFRGNLSFRNGDIRTYEQIVVSSGNMLYICLIRTSEEARDPFINAIELRTLRNGMYGQAAKTGVILQRGLRLDVGGTSTVRYPQDQFDRIWYSSQYCAQARSSEESISTINTINLPPTVVMQTACFSTGMTLGQIYGRPSLLLLYFADIELVNESGSRSFYISINGERRSETINLVPNNSAVERAFLSSATTNFTFNLVAVNSMYPPLINAVEYYTICDTQQSTDLQDIEALDAIKSRFDIKEWISDPCFVLPWDGIGCDNSSSAIRVSEIKLSGRNIAGSIPEDIQRLTALVNLSLDNNNLMGPLPDFSGLTMLERLHLQNNDLSGSVPDWLSELENLRELFIDNNNFSGVIPEQLLNKNSLNFTFSGNQYLCKPNAGECVHQNQETRSNSANPETKNNSTKGVVVGVRSVVLKWAVPVIIFVVVIIGLLACLARKKFKAKQHVNEDISMIMIPNPTDFSTFTLQEITEVLEINSNCCARPSLLTESTIPQLLKQSAVLLPKLSC